MSLDQKMFTTYKTEKINYRTGTATIGVNESCNVCTSGTFTLTLPPAALAAGRLISIVNIGTGTITVAAAANDPTLAGTMTCAAGNSTRTQALMYSDGYQWSRVTTVV